MPGMLIFEIRQRSAVDFSVTRELGFAPDPNMAAKIAEACYKKAFGIALLPDFVADEWLTDSVRDQVNLSGTDVFYNANKQDANALFYVVTHVIWNQVPFVTADFSFTLAQSDPY